MADLARVEELFTEALKKSPSERSAFLNACCGSDADLRAQVERLLAAVPNAKAFLETPTLPQPEATEKHVSAEMAGRVIAGKYKLLETIGEGGMGTVWMAQQSEPVRRNVAVKLIKAGMDSKSVLARFEAERQALALMDHPNIAKVLDGGLTEDSRPYFVMELVKGMPITEYCDKHRLTPKQRLELFVPVCMAIQHAHQKGIIHRDIKPSNVMVAMYDDKPVPKVIDFGVAKATGAQLTEQTINTGFGGIVGTPQYMSPEQAAINNLDIDTRTDVYSLGVVLYELLAGSPPFKRKELEKAGYLEILRIVREEDPPKPSTKLSTADTLPSLSANRATEPRKLTALLRNELDWIVMKALEKDRTRRYATANGFAADINRYLAGEPVLAHPPSRYYRFKKMLRKNRGPAIAAGMLLTALLAGFGGTAWGLFQARRAVAAERNALAVSDQRLHQVEWGIDLLGEIIYDLDPNAEDEGTGQPLRLQLGERLDRAAAKLDGDLVNDPLTVIRLNQVLGETQRGLGFPEKALPLLQKARKKAEDLRGPDDLITLKIVESIAGTRHDLSEMGESIRLFEDTLQRKTATLGTDHIETLQTGNNLALAYQDDGQIAKALALFRRSVDQYRIQMSGKDPRLLTAINNLALALHNDGKPGAAVQLYEEVLAVRRTVPGVKHALTLGTMNNLASAQQDAGHPDKAVAIFEEVVETMRSEFGADFPGTHIALNNLGLAFHAMGDLKRAISIYEELLPRRVRKLSADHPLVIGTQQNLAMAFLDQGQSLRSVSLFEDLVKKSSAVSGPDNPATLTLLNNLGHALLRSGQYAKARPHLERAVERRAAVLGPAHHHTLISKNNLASAYRELGLYEQARTLQQTVIADFQSTLGADHPETITAQFQMAQLYRAMGRRGEAIAAFEQVRNLSEARLPANHPDLLLRLNSLALAYFEDQRLPEASALFHRVVQGLFARQAPPEILQTVVGSALTCSDRLGEFDKADALRDKWLPYLRDQRGADSAPYAGELAAFGQSLLLRKRFADAEPVLRQALEIRTRKLPDDWRTANSQSMLGEALMGRNKFAEAEPLLQNGYEELKRRARAIPDTHRYARLAESLDRLIRLAEATDRPEVAKRWRDEKQTLPREIAPQPRRAD